MRRRVVITGLGAITSLGETASAVWENVCAGKSGITRITRWDPERFTTQIGAECAGFDPKQHGIDGREVKRLDRFAQFAIAASRGAVADAGIDFETEDRDRCGVLIGSGIGGIETLEEQANVLFSKGPSRMSPFTVPRLMVNAASGNVSIVFGLRGPTTAVATACATGANAIGDAVAMIRNGLGDVMIAGGSEAALSPMGMGSFAAARAMSTRNDDPERASRPWGHRPRRLRHGRGGRRGCPRRVGARQEAWGKDLRRGGGLRHDRRRLPHHRRDRGPAPGPPRR